MMGTNLDFDVIKFYPLTWSVWKQRYESAIRISIDLNKIHPTRVYLRQADDSSLLYGVWYRSGNWRDGRPRQFAYLVKQLAIVRVPAILVKPPNKYLVLDGMHRLSTLKPSVVLLDVIDIPKKQWCYVSDLFNPFWSKK